MNWLDTDRIYQKTAEGEAKAHAYFYVYRLAPRQWRAGRHWFGEDVDFRLKFSSAKVARDYCELYDKEKNATIIEEVRA